LGVDLLPQVFALLGSRWLDNVDTRHLIYRLGKLLWAIAIRGSQVAAGCI